MVCSRFWGNPCSMAHDAKKCLSLCSEYFALPVAPTIPISHCNRAKSCQRWPGPRTLPVKVGNTSHRRLFDEIGIAKRTLLTVLALTPTCFATAQVLIPGHTLPRALKLGVPGLASISLIICRIFSADSQTPGTIPCHGQTSFHSRNVLTTIDVIGISRSP